MVNWGKIIFGGVDSSDYGIYITGEGVYNAPERAVEFVSVPGRDGDIAIDQGRFSNIQITYPSGTFGKTQEEFREAVSAFRNAILSLRGYQRLEDTYHPDEYRMAVYTAGLEVSPAHYGTAGEFGITFECKPQRWLNCGDYPSPVQSGQIVENPTLFESKPVLLSQGYGMINFNGFSIGLENEPMGTVKFTPINYATGVVTDWTVDRLFSFEGTRFEIGDKIYLTTDYMEFNAILYFLPSETPTNISVDLNNIEQIGLNVDTSESPSVTLQFVGRPYPDTFTNIEITYGTEYSEVYNATISFDVGNTTYVYKAQLAIYYPGDDSGIAFAMSWTHTSSAVNQPSYSYQFKMNRWYGVSTYPSWHQDYDYIVIDCDIGEAYAVDSDGYVNLNKWVNFGSDLPTLSPGQNKITYDNTVTSLQIKPRWWKV